ncbi:hypothetical protein V6N12_020311 [Hibiscus sabdariffa]|uniref:Uncharacterized protein n=1 Tax=Hibiscus sabdariffa TaxID=183260 RepID=A0ABR2A022_9ROSI
MAKRKRLNVVSLIGSRAQVEEQRATSAQHQEQSQAQQSEQFEEVQGGGQQSHEEQSQPSLENINRKKVRGATLMSEIWELPKGQPEFAPINYFNWHEMPNNRKEEMWSTIELKFQFQLFDSEEGIDEATLKHVKKWVLSDMSRGCCGTYSREDK